MTNEKTIEILKELWRYSKTDKYSESEIREAIQNAIKAVEAVDYDCADCKWYLEVKKNEKPKEDKQVTDGDLISRKEVLNAIGEEKWEYLDYLKREIGGNYDIHILGFTEQIEKRIEELPTYSAEQIAKEDIIETEMVGKEAKLNQWNELIAKEDTTECKTQPMVFFSDRIMLADEYRKWIAENNVKDSPESVIAFVQNLFDMNKFTEWKRKMKGGTE